MDAAADAMEFGGLRVPSVITENLEPTEDLEAFHGEAVRLESCDIILCLFLVDSGDAEYRFFTDCGTPFHLLFTFGTSFGSFWLKLLMLLGPDEMEAPPRSDACLRCASAYCSLGSRSRARSLLYFSSSWSWSHLRMRRWNSWKPDWVTPDWRFRKRVGSRMMKLWMTSPVVPG
jgi:hypothetical protein